MPEIEIIDVTVTQPEIKIDKTSKHKLVNKVEEESQVIVHCSYTGTSMYDKIRIWKSTFLYAKGSSHRSELVHTENITLFPEWMPVERGQTVFFTLIFTGLPKNCNQFDLIEEIPEPFGFEFRNIERNDSDVYLVDLT